MCDAESKYYEMNRDPMKQAYDKAQLIVRNCHTIINCVERYETSSLTKERLLKILREEIDHQVGLFN